MATTFADRHAVDIKRDWGGIASLSWLAPVGRFFYSLIFILSGFRHFSSETISYAASSGVILPEILVPASGLMAIAGGVLILMGYHARLGALLLVLFLLPVTIVMHDFWTITDPQTAQMQMVNFMKNTSLLGGALLIFVLGSGPYSFDQGRNRL